MEFKYGDVLTAREKGQRVATLGMGYPNKPLMCCVDELPELSTSKENLPAVIQCPRCGRIAQGEDEKAASEEWNDGVEKSRSLAIRSGTLSKGPWQKPLEMVGGP